MANSLWKWLWTCRKADYRINKFSLIYTQGSWGRKHDIFMSIDCSARCCPHFPIRWPHCTWTTTHHLLYAQYCVLEAVPGNFNLSLAILFPLLNATISEISQNADVACGSGCPVLVVSADSPLSDLFIPLAVWLLRRCNYWQRLSWLCAICDVQTVMAVEGNRNVTCCTLLVI